MKNTQHNNPRPQQPIRTLSPEQQQELWQYLTVCPTDSPNAANRTRDVCMILLMLDAGLRIAEVCGLKKNDLWFGEGPVIDLTVRGVIAKNGIERTVPLSDRLREAIRKLHNHFWKDNEKIDDTQAWSEQFEGCSLSTRQVQRIVKAITTAALGMAFNPHALRHTFATKMMHLTDIRTVQMLLGHASLTSTQVYTHPTLTDLREAINKTNGGTVNKPVKSSG